jgi:hypothetical protein
MARGRGKGRGSGKRFAAVSAEEIEQRNARLAEFDAARQQRRADTDSDDDDGSVDSAKKAAEREALLVGMRVAEMSVDDGEEGGDKVSVLDVNVFYRRRQPKTRGQPLSLICK